MQLPTHVAPIIDEPVGRRRMETAMQEQQAAINREELVITAVLGEITSPAMDGNPYEITARGEPVVPVGTGGIRYNVRVGMPAGGWEGEQVEPGVSIANPVEGANMALNVFA